MMMMIMIMMMIKKEGVVVPSWFPSPKKSGAYSVEIIISKQKRTEKSPPGEGHVQRVRPCESEREAAS
jgi:hypothetical protein